MEFIELLKSRHSIRTYGKQQIKLQDLQRVIEAGIYAPSAGGGQRTILVGIHNKELTAKIGEMNLAKFNRKNLAGSYVSKEQPSVIDNPSIHSGFYGAPAVVAVFAQKDFLFREADAYCCAENMVLQATELGLASCIISRGKETFADEEGQRLTEKWQIPNNYEAVCFVVLGYLKGPAPTTKERRAGRIKIVE